jgi:hypothetical protein
MGRDFLEEAVAAVSVPFTSLNVIDAETNKFIGRPFVVKQAAGLNVALFGLSDPLDTPRSLSEVGSSGHKDQSDMSSNETLDEDADWNVRIADPLEALEKHRSFITDKSGHRILLSSLTREQNTLIAQRFPEISFIIGNDPQEVYRSVNSTLILNNKSSEGKKIGRLVLSFDQDGSILDYKIDWLPITKKYVEDREIRRILEDFYAKVASNKKLWEEVEPLFSSFELESDRTQKYAGAAKCAPCHQKIYASWRKSEHAGAYNTLVEKNRYFYPDCVNCHTTGAGYSNGFRIDQTTKHLEGVQCEICHGPGSKHVDAEGGSDLRVTSDREFCVECHNDDVSPGFEDGFEDMLAMVNHYNVPADLRTNEKKSAASARPGYPNLKKLRKEDRTLYEMLFKELAAGCKSGHLLFECKGKSAAEKRTYLDKLLAADRDFDSLMSKMVEKYGPRIKSGEREVARYRLRQQSVDDALRRAADETDHVSLELFVVSYGPTAIRTENLLFELREQTYGDRLDITLHFIAQEGEKGGPATERFTSHNGQREVEEDIRQLLIQKYHPDKLATYLAARNRSITTTDWRKCAFEAGIDPEEIELRSAGAEGAELLSEDLQVAASKKINLSPTLLINGKRFLGRFPK